MKSLVEFINESSGKWSKDYMFVLVQPYSEKFDEFCDDLEDICYASAKDIEDARIFIVPWNEGRDCYGRMTEDNVDFFWMSSLWKPDAFDRLLDEVKRKGPWDMPKDFSEQRDGDWYYPN